MSNYNLNAGYGNALSLPFLGSGKVRVVGDSGTANRSMLTELFKEDADGEVRFFATIDAAVGACTANAGDVIYVMPGHTETVTEAAGLDLDVAGISVIGLGKGSDRPTVNFTTAVGADMDIGAANIYVENILFTGGIDALTGPIDINAADCTLKNIETRDVTGQTVDFIVTDANADRLSIDGWVHRGAEGAGADTAISIVGGEDISIENFDIDGNFAVAGIENVTTEADNIRIGARSQGNLIQTRNSADILVTVAAAATGYIDNILGRVADDAANITEAISIGNMQAGNNLYIVNADGERAIQWNGTQSADSA